ncbi:hypothetical protein FIBSPDRAFT_948842 [Athelia psychrophila]|uniref:Uncharacterized protein n=1 Tax=Athelia psychrophila TaxID=1759441 RepID=A0A166QJJ5_9AGAM|nr:hypothetical protein FIBSPDRAFT_948842 [Fibularhizoctonia sp. CBS 109695]
MEALVKKGKVKGAYRCVQLQGEVPLGDPPNSRDHAHCQPARDSLVHPPAQPPRVPQFGTDRRAGILPLGTNQLPLLADNTATAIAKKHRLHTSDELLGYLRGGAGHRVLPKLVTPARIASNCIGTVAAVKRLTEDDLQTLDMAAVGWK